MGMSVDFWRDQTGWPRDTSDMTFLGRAVLELGAALFGEEWTGQECGAESIRIHPTADDRDINNLIAKHLPQFKRREFRLSMAPPPISLLGHPDVEHTDIRPEFNISGDERIALHSFVETHNAAAAQAAARFKEVQNKIAAWAADDKLNTAYRVDGEFTAIPRAWWNDERLDQRFTFCKINPNDPFGSGQKAWIFVSGADLTRLLASRQEVTSNTTIRCQKWLEAEFKNDPERQKTRGDFAKLAAQKFKFSPDSNAFDRAWSEAVKTDPERSKGGRRPSANNRPGKRPA